jgi:hypothetical protein
MISDVLAEAVHQIDEYLSNPTYQAMYQGDVLTRIRLVRHAMEDLRQELDTPPDTEKPPSGELFEENEHLLG